MADHRHITASSPTHIRALASSAPITIHDPLLFAVTHYRETVDGMREEGTTDADVETAFKAALAPLHANPSPVARTMQGAAEALRLVLSLQGLDATDTILVRGALAFIDRRS